MYAGRFGLTVFDGAAIRPTAITAVDLCVADGVLYVLGDGVVYWTRDLSTWATITGAPPDATSLGVLDGVLFVGTADSRLYHFIRPGTRALRLERDR